MYNDDRLTLLSEKIRQLEDEIIECEWNNELYRAAILVEELAYYRVLQETGELYVPNF